MVVNIPCSGPHLKEVTAIGWPVLKTIASLWAPPTLTDIKFDLHTWFNNS